METRDPSVEAREITKVVTYCGSDVEGAPFGLPNSCCKVLVHHTCLKGHKDLSCLCGSAPVHVSVASEENVLGGKTAIVFIRGVRGAALVAPHYS